jgi:hypothetical protein
MAEVSHLSYLFLYLSWLCVFLAFSSNTLQFLHSQHFLWLLHHYDNLIKRRAEWGVCARARTHTHTHTHMHAHTHTMIVIQKFQNRCTVKSCFKGWWMNGSFVHQVKELCKIMLRTSSSLYKANSSVHDCEKIITWLIERTSSLLVILLDK